MSPLIHQGLFLLGFIAYREQCSCLGYLGIYKSTDIVCLFILRTYVTIAVFACTFLVVGVVFLLVVAEKCVVSK